MPKRQKIAECSRVDARRRLKIARAYLDVAEMVLEDSRGEFANVAAGLAVLAGIAAADAITCVRSGVMHRGDDHRDAADVLRRAVPDGRQLAAKLLTLLDVKDGAHYGAPVLSPSRAKGVVRKARALVERAAEEIAR